eukprot:GHRR01014064.1.p1 GENE.GHRR01014064.1~~GHRR01014064.1.p1  ORF type:complete len:435 (+),score=113.80 GHRR01014064.1:526-1830(+)
MYSTACGDNNYEDWYLSLRGRPICIPHGWPLMQDLTAGTVAGVAQLFIGHPFDTIKVKLQSQSSTGGTVQYSGPLDAAKQTLMREGIKGIYKGMGAPLATVALFNAVLFASRGQMEVLLAHKDGSPLHLSGQLIASVGASCAVSLVATPTELLKCRLQAQGCSAAARQRLINAGVDPAMVRLLVHTHDGRHDPSSHCIHCRGPVVRCLLPAFWRRAVRVSALFHRPRHASYMRHAVRGCRQQFMCRSSSLGATHQYRALTLCSVLQHIMYCGPGDVARHVLRREGGLLGLYKGFNATLVRESMGNMAMFGVYELMKQQFVAAKGLEGNEQLSHLDLLLAGGLGGTAFWLACYPADIVKSKLQLDSYDKPRFQGILDCGRQVVAQGGVKGLFKGFAPALARSFPANAVCFAVYEATKSAINSFISQLPAQGSTRC